MPHNNYSTSRKQAQWRPRIVPIAILAATLAPLVAAQKPPQSSEEKYDSGKIKARYTLEPDGSKNGSFQTFYEDGKVKETGDYLHGDLDGRFFSYHPNGQRALTCAYIKGALDGDWVTFDDAGKTSATGVYHAGKKSGIFQQISAGKILSEQFFLDDQLLLPRSAAEINTKLADIRIRKVATVPAPADEPIPDHKAQKQSEDDRVAGVRKLMEYRYLCNVPDDISLDAVYNAHDEAAAEILLAIGHLDHHPPNPGWPDADYKFAVKGTSSSNLWMGSASPTDAINGFMADSDASNIDRLGHRRWCINPAMAKTGFASAGRFVAMWSFDRSRTDIPDYDFVACPSAGLFPTTYFRPSSAWSVSLNPDKYRAPVEKNVHVKVQPAQLSLRPATLHLAPPLRLNYYHIDNQGFGIPNAIIFRFDGCHVQNAAAYQVEITGLENAAGEPTTLKYFVEFFAPAK